MSYVTLATFFVVGCIEHVMNIFIHQEKETNLIKWNAYIYKTQSTLKNNNNVIQYE